MKRVQEAFKHHDAVMVQMPTVTGATIVLANIVCSFLEKSNNPIWIVAHRRELVEQIKETIFSKITPSLFTLKEGDVSKTHPSSLTLKGGSTAFPKPLSPQGTGDVTASPDLATSICRSISPCCFWLQRWKGMWASSSASQEENRFRGRSWIRVRRLQSGRSMLKTGFMNVNGCQNPGTLFYMNEIVES